MGIQWAVLSYICTSKDKDPAHHVVQQSANIHTYCMFDHTGRTGRGAFTLQQLHVSMMPIRSLPLQLSAV